MTASLDEAAHAISQRTGLRPKIGVVLGSGLGGFADALEEAVEIPYAEIPGWPAATAVGHAGTLVLGTFGGAPVAVMRGRAHLYEGLTPEKVVFGVRVLGRLGIGTLLLTNAVGGIREGLEPGRLVLVSDHLNLQASSPLVGPNDDELGPRFPDMCFAYDRELLKLAQTLALAEGIVCHKGVYVAVSGPNLETRAEYRFLREIGGDVVGMSTVPEVIVAVHCGLRALGISVITDMCLPDALGPASIADIIATAQQAEKKLRVLVRRVIESLSG